MVDLIAGIVAIVFNPITFIIISWLFKKFNIRKESDFWRLNKGKGC